jgi:hypothetical protein
MSSASPKNTLSTRVMLATGIHAQPGVYALLLGSGVSRSAGISTGWEIVQHLVQKAAAAESSLPNHVVPNGSSWARCSSPAC